MLNDIRYAFRQIRRSIGFSTTVIVILAAGLGANITLFSLMHALVFQSMPGVVRMTV